MVAKAQDKMTELVSKLVSPRYFAEATRESGYKGTTHALAELIDNSLQANATQVHVHFQPQEYDPKSVWVYILDNGDGMDASVMSAAPQFGGTTRFNNREGIGRFGMGLPNSSVSQCRRFEIYSRKAGGELLYCYLDLDQVAGLEEVEDGFLTPVVADHWPVPDALASSISDTGTLVIWKKCDRLSPKNVDNLKSKVTGFLGQAFRNFVYPMIEDTPSHLITVNGDVVRPFDPLYLHPNAIWSGADEWGTSSEYDIAIPKQKGKLSKVRVKYSILPISLWQNLTTAEKRERRIFANKGFSIVRAGREIEVTDRFFLVGQGGEEGRIINNDAWWGCEISFEPELDEVFGVTHTKQEVHPDLDALQQVCKDISLTVQALRAERQRRWETKKPGTTHPSEQVAKQADGFLPPRPEVPQDPKEVEAKVEQYVQEHAREGEEPEKTAARVMSNPFTLELKSDNEGPFYRPEYFGDKTVVYLNTDHPFYKEIYAPLNDNLKVQNDIELLLFTLAHGERQAGLEGRKWYLSQRNIWSNILQTYLNK